MTRLTDEHYQRFYKLAPSILENRTAGYYLIQIESGFNIALAGAIPIFGLVFLEWSAANWLVMLVAGCWMGFLCDILKFSQLKNEINDYVDRTADDTFVSVISESIRANKTEVVSDYIPRKPDYLKGLLVDLVFGTVSTVIVLMSLRGVSGVFDQSWFVPSLVFYLAWRFLMTIWDIWSHRKNPQRKPIVKLAFGLRGVGMFLFLFVVLFCSGDKESLDSTSSRYVACAICGAMVLCGPLSLWGTSLIFRESRWLRKHLNEGNEVQVKSS